MVTPSPGPAEAVEGGADPTRRYVFLASSAYSGSTLLSLLLGAHPDISTTSDVSGTRRANQMETFRCSCGRLMLECPFWSEVGERMVERRPDFDLADFRTGFDTSRNKTIDRLRVGSMRWSNVERTRDALMRVAWPGHEEQLTQAGARSQELAEVVMDITGTHVFLDASKERLRPRHLHRYLSMELLVVHLVRDPRGVVDSALRRHEDEGETLERAAGRWVGTQRTLLRLRDELPEGRWLQVSYEALCSDVQSTLERIFRFCRVDPDVPQAPQPEQHLLGNKMRLGGYEEISLDERWHTGLSGAQQRQVLDIAGTTMERLGLDRGAPAATG